MKAQKLDMTLALKAIVLSPHLTRQEARIAALVLDHYNHKTGQCDPSLSTIAALLNVHRRTVIRAVDKIERLNFLRRDRHGGKNHRNSYEWSWELFRRLESEWKARRKIHSQRWKKELSPLQGQHRHLAGGDDATQTCLKNISDLTSAAASEEADISRTNQTKSPKRTDNEQNAQRSLIIAEPFHGKQIPERIAARLKARLAEPVFDSWLRDVVVQSDDGAVVVLAASTRFRKDWLVSKYGPQILECWQVECPSVDRVDIVMATPKSRA